MLKNSNNPMYALLPIINQLIEPDTPLDDKIDWPTFNAAVKYCDEKLKLKEKGD